MPPFTRGNRVVWTAGPPYGRYRGAGEVQGSEIHLGILLIHVRWDDPGLDDEYVPSGELRRED